MNQILKNNKNNNERNANFVNQLNFKDNEIIKNNKIKMKNWRNKIQI